MRDSESSFTRAGANLVAVGLGDMHYARAFRTESGIDFPLLVDEQRKAYRAVNLRSASLFHLLRRDNAAARKRARNQGHTQRSLGRDPFQLGASFVFGPGNEDFYIHLSETFGDNAPIESLLASLSP